MEFTVLRELSKAIAYLRAQGFTVRKDHTTLKGGRKAYYVTGRGWVHHVNDYELLALASNDGQAW